MWILFPGQGLNRSPLNWERDIWMTRPPGNKIKKKKIADSDSTGLGGSEILPSPLLLVWGPHFEEQGSSQRPREMDFPIEKWTNCTLLELQSPVKPFPTAEAPRSPQTQAQALGCSSNRQLFLQLHSWSPGSWGYSFWSFSCWSDQVSEGPWVGLGGAHGEQGQPPVLCKCLLSSRMMNKSDLDDELCGQYSCWGGWKVDFDCRVQGQSSV